MQEVHEDIAAMLTRPARAEPAMAQGKDPKQSDLRAPAQSCGGEDRGPLCIRPGTDFQENAVDPRDRYSKRPPKIDIHLDKKAMDEAGIGADVTVSKNLKGVPLRLALRSMLHELGLAYVVQDDVLLITTTEAEEQKPATCGDPVADLVERYRDDKGTVLTDSEPLTDKIDDAVQPKTWAEKGGPGSMCAYRGGRHRRFLISQTQQVQEEVAALAVRLRKAKSAGDRKQPLSPEQLPLKASPPGGAGGRVGFSPAGAAACSAATRCRPACRPARRGRCAGLGAGPGVPA